MKCTLMTLVYPIDQKNNRILLGLKKVRIGEGTHVGFGGRVEPGETIFHSAVRELEEESSLIANESALSLQGRLLIRNKKYQDLGRLEIPIFTLNSWVGVPVDSSEIAPQWFDLQEIPWNSMRESERYWLPAVLKGWKTFVDIWYNKNEVIEKMTVKIS